MYARSWSALLGAVTVVLTGVTVAVLVSSGGASEIAGRPRGGDQTPVGAPTVPGSSAALQTPVDPPAATARPAVPVRVSVPRLGISSGLEALGLAHDGSLEAPSAYGRAGWYDSGPRPGELGPAIVVGHVDSVSGPAVFFALHEARAGDLVLVRDRGGTVRRFTVTGVQRYRKALFPTTTVYGPTARPELRLITCSGAFDARARSYVDNLVVSATLSRRRPG